MVRDEVEVRWRLLRLLQQAGRKDLADRCLDAIVIDYALRLDPERRSWRLHGISVEQVERSVARHAATVDEAAVVIGRTYSLAADRFQARGDLEAAAAFYLAGWKHCPRAKSATKYVLSRLGPYGQRVRRLIDQFAA